MVINYSSIYYYQRLMTTYTFQCAIVFHYKLLHDHQSSQKEENLQVEISLLRNICD